MRSEQITINIYEIGDVIDISKVSAIHQKERLTAATKAVVIGCRKLKTGKFSYNVLTNEGKRCDITPEEMGTEKYIGHIDMSMLFGE